MQLRPYQRAAVEAVYQYLREKDDNPIVVCPTGAGKSLILAQIASDAVKLWQGRVLILAHVKELLQQNTEKLRALCPELPIGIYSSGLGRRDCDTPVVVAGIQSVYRRASELGRIDVCLVDEAHTIAPEGDGMYRTLLADLRTLNPALRIVGCTATPFRTTAGSIVGPDQLFQNICYEIGIKPLIRDGYLCPLVSKAGATRVDTSKLHIRGGEFVAGEVEHLMDQVNLVQAACREIITQTQDRRACLIFASGIGHAKHIVRTLREQHGTECGLVTGDTPAIERAELIARFRGDVSHGLLPCEPLKYLCNVNVLTTGTDIPRIDCIALLRPTNSPGLMYQSIGRGFRVHPEKQNCQILDFGGNIMRHGPVDQLRTDNPDRARGEARAKECSECHTLVALGCATCPECGHVFPGKEDQRRHEPSASTGGVLSGQVTVETYSVLDTHYGVHLKRGADENSPRSMRVDYKIGWNQYKSEWICFEHEGYARRKAEAWWKQRSLDPMPATAEQAVAVAEAGGVAVAVSITVRSVAGERFERITDYELGPVPEGVSERVGGEEEVPF